MWRDKMRQPEDYWETRAIITENILNTALLIIAEANPALYEPLYNLVKNWDDAIEEVDKEFKQIHKSDTSWVEL